MKFTLPEDLAALSAGDLAALEASALTEFDALQAIAPEDLTDEQFTALEALAAAVTSIRDEAARKETAAADRAARVAAASGVLTAAKDEAKAKAEEPKEASPNVKGQPEPDGRPDPAEEGTVGSKVNQPVPPSDTVPNYSSRSVVASVTKRPVPTPARSTAVSVRAAADVPGHAAASSLEGMSGIVSAVQARMGAFPRAKNPAPGQYLRNGAVTIHREDEGVLTASNAPGDYEVVMEAGKESRLEGGSLLAAGGWCAPSETFYDLCTTETLDGLVDIPEINVNRGGIRFTKGPEFDAIYANSGFTQTEADAIAGVEKTCYEVPCTDFSEIRLDVIGVCVKAPILTNVGYPELVQRWIEGTMVAHEHKKSAKTINSMVAAAGAAVTATGAWGASNDLLAALEWHVETQRYRYRMALNATLEVVLPHWVLPILRQDIALRQGAEVTPLTDQALNALFAARGARVQYVYDWQPLVTTGGTAPVGSNKVLAPYPTTVNVLAYPAGTFVRGRTDVISLDTIYDTTDLKTNVYTALFMEEGILVANRCYNASLLTVPLNVQGSTAGPLAAGTKYLPR